MKINYIKTAGFRKFKDIFETNVYDVTKVTGKNRSGKSNILYAIVNTFLGTNLSGNEKACLINRICDKSYGELHFTDNEGIEHVLIREKSRFANKKNFLSLDGKLTNQSELVKFYKDKKLFLTILNPMYFLRREPAEQKEMVDKYLSDVKPIEIFNKLNKLQQKELLDKYYKGEKEFEKLTSIEQEKFINTKITNICMDLAYNKLSKKEQSILEGMPKNIPTYITELNENIGRNEKDITLLDGNIEYANKITEESLPSRREFEKEEELNLELMELDTLASEQQSTERSRDEKLALIEKIEMEISKKREEYEKLNTEMKQGKIKYISMKDGADVKCPICNQELIDEAKEIAIDNFRIELVKKFEKSKQLDDEIKKLEVELNTEKCKFYAAKEHLENMDYDRLEEVKANVKKLENEKAEIDRFNNEIIIKAKNIATAKANIKKFSEEKQKKQQNIDNMNAAIKIARKLYINYLEEKMQIAKKYLKDVSMKFYTVLKTTGEVKEDFKIMYKNNQLSDLSRSEMIATGLEFANLFNKISGVNLPIFIDDYESCADYDFVEEYAKDTQVITATVEKGNLLKIADANNSANATIIKTNIKGYRTMKVQKVSNQNTKKVA